MKGFLFNSHVLIMERVKQCKLVNMQRTTFLMHFQTRPYNHLDSFIRTVYDFVPEYP